MTAPAFQFTTSVDPQLRADVEAIARQQAAGELTPAEASRRIIRRVCGADMLTTLREAAKADSLSALAQPTTSTTHEEDPR